MFYTEDVGPISHTAIHDGDLVRLDGDPVTDYAVILVRGGRAWVRNLQNGMDTLAGLSLCRRVGHESLFGS